MQALENFLNRLFKKGPLFVFRHYCTFGYVAYHLRRLEVFLSNRRVNIFDRFLFKDRKRATTLRKAFVFHNVTWGQEHLDMLFRYAIPSVMQDGNIPTLKADGYRMKFFLYTNQSAIETVKETYASVIEKCSQYLDFEIFSFESIIGHVDLSDKGPLLQKTFTKSIKYCLDNECSLVNFCSDAFLGNESLYNLAKLSEGKDVTIAAAHPRVFYKEVIKEEAIKSVVFEDSVVSNETLVALAFKESNSRLSQLREEDDYSMSHLGLAVKKISEKTYSVVHSLPSPYFLNFTWEDYKFFRRRNYNNIDKTWPRKLLKENRLKIVGSSDVFFMIELTPSIEDRSISGNLYNDICMTRSNRHMWHYFANSVVTIWKMK